MKKFGLIGYPLSHSFSKKYFAQKFEDQKIPDCEYNLYPLEKLDTFKEFLHQNPDLCGLNVTIPYKVDVMPYLDWISHEARAIGAVNCIKVTGESPVTAAFTGELGVKGHDFRLDGFNTDAYGFESSLKPLLKAHHNNALILGDGGAAKAVKYVLQKLNIAYVVVTRRAVDNNTLFTDLSKQDIKNHTLIVNTTPLGTFPDIDQCPPIPYEYLTHEHLLYDLIYNPDETLFLKKGKEKGATTKNGLEMLILQAERSWEIWNSKEPHA